MALQPPAGEVLGAGLEQAPSTWPPGFWIGILAGLGAGALWGLTFVTPLVAPAFSAVDYTVGRFVACGLFALLLLGLGPLRSARDGKPRAVRWPTAAQAGAALGISVLGYTGYYLVLVWAIEAIGSALPVLIIGTIPLALMVLGKPRGLRWRLLFPGLLLTALGLGLMAQHAGLFAGGAAVAGWAGVAWAFAAMASWTAFALLNAAWLRRHPEVDVALWANWLGLAAGAGGLLMALLWGLSWSGWSQRPNFGAFLWVCAFTGVGSAWLAGVLWNLASRHLSPSLAGQLIVSETVFGLTYSFAWHGQWPAPLQWAAAGLFVLGIAASIRAHR